MKAFMARRAAWDGGTRFHCRQPGGAVDLMKRLKRLALGTIAIASSVLRRTPIVRWKWLGRLQESIVLKLRSRDEVRVGPFRVFVDPRDKVIAGRLALYGGFEEREIELLCSLVRQGDCVLDIGANIGLYSLALSRAVGPEGKVIAFEPDDDNLALLRKNVHVNGCGNVTVISDALGDKAGTAHLYQPQDNRGALSTRDILGVGASRAVAVNMRRADEVLTEIGRPARIAKIDVEGAEPEVLKRFGSMMPEVLMFEFVPWQLTAAGHDPLGMLKSLSDAGYTLQIIDPASGTRTTLPPNELLETVQVARSDRNVLAMRTAVPELSQELTTLRSAI